MKRKIETVVAYGIIITSVGLSTGRSESAKERKPPTMYTLEHACLEWNKYAVAFQRLT